MLVYLEAQAWQEGGKETRKTGGGGLPEQRGRWQHRTQRWGGGRRSQSAAKA